MPVLSEQMAETEPSVSTEGSRLTMAPWAASARVPIEYMVVTTAGRPVGMAEIARAMPAMKIVSKVSPWLRPRMTIKTNARPASPAMMMVSLSSCFCKGVLSDSVLLSRSAMLPISVPMPVVVTIISARRA